MQKHVFLLKLLAEKISERDNIELQYRHFLSQTGGEEGRK